MLDIMLYSIGAAKVINGPINIGGGVNHEWKARYNNMNMDSAFRSHERHYHERTISQTTERDEQQRIQIHKYI
jgi:hypothetical protein